MKKYLKLSLIPIISLIVLNLLFSILNIFDINISNTIYLISTIIIYMITGYYVSLNIKGYAYKIGIITGIIIVSILFILNLLLFSINKYSFIYYFIIILSTLFGAIIKNIKKSNL